MKVKIHTAICPVCGGGGEIPIEGEPPTFGDEWSTSPPLIDYKKCYRCNGSGVLLLFEVINGR